MMKILLVIFSTIFIFLVSYQNELVEAQSSVEELPSNKECYKLIKLLEIDSEGRMQLCYYMSCLKDSNDIIANDIEFLDSLVFTIVDTLKIQDHLSVEIYFDNKDVHEFIPGHGISDSNNLFEKPRFAFYGLNRTHITVRNIGEVNYFKIPLPEYLLK